ncbi:DsbA family protein [Psychromonas marina]|uniref:DsbA family protein n=1 Tax=Psychromonas marina TaxID=88364 RepID=A0ABQ6E295_9GAMM|nr:DsbA family protein [Psychromonas marina]GLS91529.1 DsbA family protein [Psychromonas marina]
MVKIHYFFDPMCGWCFGSTALIKAIKQQGIELELHPGGMIERRPMEAGFRQVVVSYDERIQVLTGQQFGTFYKARIASNETIILDSFLTAKAIMTAQALIGKGVEMLEKIQQAYYQQGLDVSDNNIIEQLALTIGIEQLVWQKQMQVNNNQIDHIIDENRQLMSNYQLNGFPSLLLEKEDGTMQTIPHSQFYGDLNKWYQWLKKYN